MKICPACQVQYPDDAMVCGQCGSRLMLDTSATMPDPKQSLVGRVIGGNYKLESILGQGGMGMVFRARQLSLDRTVAVKLLLAPLAMDREMLERFQREARAASNIGHPGIVQVIDMGYLPEGAPFMVMEHLEGEDLRSKLEREGAMSLGLAVPLFLQMCEALQAAHDKGIVHRDLKPDNIFLVYRTGGLPMVKILDFGLSKIKSAESKLTNTGALLGTPNYMSPEQVHGSSSSIDHRTDIYTAGIILYEMVTGRFAYDGPSVQSILVSIATQDPPPPRVLRPDLPEALESVILRAIARQPERRYQSLRELGVDLVRVAGSLGVPLSQPGMFSGAGQASGSSPWQPAPEPPSGQPQAASVPTPATPPPLSAAAPAAGPVPLKKKSGRGLLVGLGIGAAVLIVFLALVGIVLLKIGIKRARLAKKLGKTKLELKGTYDEENETLGIEIDDSSGDQDEADESDQSGASFPGHKVGTGKRPWLCCGDKSCVMVYEKTDVFNASIWLQRLSEDLAPRHKPKPLSPEEGMHGWPVCYARDDGFLVLYQELDPNFGSIPQVKVHAVVVSAEGKVTSRSSMTFPSMQMDEETQPAFTSQSVGDWVFVVWNDFDLNDMSTKLVVLDLDGKKKKSPMAVNSDAVTLSSTVTCRSDRCMIGWLSMTASTKPMEMVALVSPAGKIIEKGKTTVSSSPASGNRKLMGLKDGVIMAWKDMTHFGSGVTKIAGLDWDGKVIMKPKAVEVFGNDPDTYTLTRFAAAAPDGSGFILAQAVELKNLDRTGVMALFFDPKGKVKSKDTIALADEDIDNCSVFFKPDGRPVLIYEPGFGSDVDLYAMYLKLKK